MVGTDHGMVRVGFRASSGFGASSGFFISLVARASSSFCICDRAYSILLRRKTMVCARRSTKTPETAGNRSLTILAKSSVNVISISLPSSSPSLKFAAVSRSKESLSSSAAFRRDMFEISKTAGAVSPSLSSPRCCKTHIVIHDSRLTLNCDLWKTKDIPHNSTILIVRY
jgi:hypothetical protein